MPASFQQIFLGVAPSPLRDAIAAHFDPDKHKRLIHPCVGKWSIPTLVAKRFNQDMGILEASDISLYSTLIGLAANPDLTFEQFGIQVPPNLERFVDGVESRSEHVAGVLLALKFLLIPSNTAYTTEMQRELLGRMKEYRTSLADRVDVQAQLLAGASYALRDVRDVVAEVAERDSEEDFITASLPMYAGDYAKLYDEAERQLWEPTWDERAFDPAEIEPTLGSLTGLKCTAVSLMYQDDERIPEGWTKLLAVDRGRNRIDYVIANQDFTYRQAFPIYRKAKPRKFPVWDQNDEITKDSQIEYIAVDGRTGLHYRDLFVHRLGQTNAEMMVLLMIDGKVACSVGLYLSDAALGKIPWVLEMFGVTCHSAKYPKLNKLNTLLLTTEEFKEWLMRRATKLNMVAVHGIQTTTLSKTPTSKVDRGILDLVSTEVTPDGYKLRYRGKWREGMSYSDGLKMWLDKWGNPPPQQQAKPKRTRSDNR
jgi:hypothetical protein